MGLPDDLERLAALHRSGALSDAEFASAKARALGSTPNADVGGVCGGLAPATGLPSWLWRLIFLALMLCGGTGLILYVLLWILVPTEAAAPDLGTGSYRST